MAHSAIRNTYSQHLNSQHSNAKHLARRRHLISSLIITASALLIIASGGVSTLFAWEVGQRHSVVLGAVSVAFALGLELAKPFSIDAAFRSVRELRFVQAAMLALVGFLAVTYSLQASLTFMSMTRGDLVAQRATDADAGQRARQRYKRAERELSSLAPTRPVAELAAEIAAIDVRPGITVDGKPCGGTLNGPVTREWCPRRAALVAEQARAHRRAALQAELRDVEQRLSDAPSVAVADPGAAALATYAESFGLQLDPGKLGLWLPLVGVLALEAGAAFSVVLVKSVTASGPQLAASPAESPATAGNAVAHEQTAKVAQSVETRKRGPRKSRRRPPDDKAGGPPQRGLAGLLDTLKAEGGAVELSQRQLARKVGASRSTLQRALGDLAAAGAVVLDTSKSGTRVALA
jgi:hypothetical protein